MSVFLLNGLLVACGSGGQQASTDSSTPATATGTPAQDGDPRVRNAVNFHLLDFVAWNNRDWAMFRHLHTADVKVEMAGMKTEGIDAHVAAMEAILKQMPDSRLVQHTPTIAEGEWTCVVGLSPGLTVATVAKWRDGAISEEYLFMTPLPAGTAPPALQGEPIARISNDGAPRALTGAEPGWSCVFGRAASGKYVVAMTKTAGDGPAQSIVFAD
jgi:hypothetical protein